MASAVPLAKMIRKKKQLERARLIYSFSYVSVAYRLPAEEVTGIQSSLW